MKYVVSGIRAWTPLLVGSMFLFVCSCTNLSAVREFARNSANSLEYTRLTEAYVQWPQTQKRFQPANQYAHLDRLAGERKLQENELLLRHSIIQDYMQVLGELASDEVVTYDKEIDSLGDAAAAANFIEVKDGAAYAAIAKLVVTATTDRWRQAKLKKFVTTSNDDLQTLLASLKEILKNGYLGDLKDEKVAVGMHYGGLVSKSKDPAGIAALQEWQREKEDSIALREQAIQEYLFILQKIAQAHQQLTDAISVNNVTSNEFLGQMSRYAKDIRATFNAIVSMNQ